jgi:DEAD/DEAH box helicase domain-containing protein
MAVDDVISLLEKNSYLHKRVVQIDSTDQKYQVYGDLESPLSDKIAGFLENNNMRLYSHQCSAINQIQKGYNVIITTPTASGKTLAFTIPVFERLGADSKARALYLYPRKALSNDQLLSLQ